MIPLALCLDLCVFCKSLTFRTCTPSRHLHLTYSCSSHPYLDLGAHSPILPGFRATWCQETSLKKCGCIVSLEYCWDIFVKGGSMALARGLRRACSSPVLLPSTAGGNNLWHAPPCTFMNYLCLAYRNSYVTRLLLLLSHELYPGACILIS